MGHPLSEKSINRIIDDAQARDTDVHSHGLKVLGVRDLTFLGIAAVVAPVFFHYRKCCI